MIFLEKTKNINMIFPLKLVDFIDKLLIRMITSISPLDMEVFIEKKILFNNR